MKKLAIAAAALLLTGCQVPALTVTVTPTTPVAAKATGAVRVALAGLAMSKAYRTLAVRSDVAKLKATLTSHAAGKSQVREIGPKELAKPQAYIDFDAVAAGKATLTVDAFDAAGRAIGRGENATAIVGGKVNNLHVKVKLDANAGEGKINAIVTFEDGPGGEPYPADGQAAFRKADRDADGWVSLSEYQAGWPHGWGGVAYPLPGVAAPDQAMPAMTVGNGGTTIGILPPAPNDATSDFKRRDRNGDARLSLDEFLSPGVYYAVPMASK